MIPNQWYVVLDSSQVKSKPVGVTRMGEKLVFWRDNTGRLSCLWDRCVHRGVEPSKGRVVSDGCLQCPFHGFECDATGRVQKIPANGRKAPVPERFQVRSYPTHEAHGFIWIWWGENPPDDLAPPPFFDDMDDLFAYGQVRDPWDAHYSRVIENQLDVVHLPFVHHNTIGRGRRTLIEGPGIEWLEEDRFNVYVYNKVDDGTVLYLRFYQKFVPVPVLGKLIAQLSMPFNVRIAHQDRRVVVTQQPRGSALKGGERLIQGDKPIVEYRRRRQELIDLSNSARRDA